MSRGSDAARGQIRGSGLLLSGRGIALAAKLAAQMLVVRHLSAADFGAWAYALSVVALLSGFSSLSLDRVASRFLAIYHQRGEHGRFAGLLLLAVGTVAATSAAFAVALLAFPDALARLAGGDDLPLAILGVLVFLVPLEALDQFLVAVLATFGRARAIFVRRHLLAPALQLGVVVALVAADAGVRFLAAGYVAGTLLGVLVYAALLVRLLRREELLRSFARDRVQVPAREVFGFAVPLMTSDWLAALVQASVPMGLAYFHGTEAVGAFRVVLPLAALNEVVLQSFTLLYVPAASRLFAAGDREGVGDLYWRTAAWVAVLSFPVFALTFALATPLTALVFGERYAGSGPVLAVLALGYYAQAALGFNGSTLKVLGRVRALVVVNLLAVGANLLLAALLVPRFGAIGGAAAVAGTLVAHNALKQAALHRVAGVGAAGPYLRVYATIGAGAAVLVLLRLAGVATPLLLVPAALASTAGVLLLTRGTLRIGEVFPELRRVPLLRPILS